MKKLVQKVELMKEEKQALEENSASLKDQIRKLSIDGERLLKSFQSDSEVKTYYEKCLNELEELRHQEKARFSNELEKLQQENESIQGLLASLQEENNHLRGSQELSARRLECCEDELTHASTLRSQLEEKIITLQSQLNDLTSANSNLYINLEKELSHKSDLVSLSQLSRHLEQTLEVKTNKNCKKMKTLQIFQKNRSHHSCT